MKQNESEDRLEYVVLGEDELVRLDKFVTLVFPQFSRTLVQKLIQDGLLEVNGHKAKNRDLPQPGDEIVILDVPITEMDLEPEDIPLVIVYEDEDVLVVDKPAGMVVHPAPGSYDHTLVNALLWHVKTLSALNGPIRPGIVHRIDKDTSGLLMVAKNDFSHARLAAELAAKTTKREYIGLVDGLLLNDKGTIDMPIGRDPHDRKRMAVVENGKRAITHFAVLERFRNRTLVKCILETGRTHQIRVHLAQIGYPVSNDPIYNPNPQTDPERGQYLHAATLGFTHPRTEIFLEFGSPLPEYFENYLQILRDDR